jgi:predicted permease
MAMSRLRSWLGGLLDRRRVERDMADEMAFHLQARTDHWVAQGLAPVEAARRARLEFGPVERYQEESRQARGLRLVDELRGDLVYAARTLRAAPVFTAVAVAILAIAIGANTAVFSVVEAVMVRQLPVVRPGELRQLAWVEPADRDWQMRYDGSARPGPDGGRLMTSFSWPVYTQLREHTTAFSSLFVAVTREVNLDANGRAQRAQALVVSGDFMDGIGTPPAIGRGLGPDDDRRDAAPIAVLSHRLWRSAFGGDPRVLGRTVRINATPAVVVGVAPPTFEGLQPGEPFDVMVPVTSFAAATEGQDGPLGERRWAFGVMGRLRPGVDEARALAETDALFRRAVPPDFLQGTRPPRVVLAPGGQGFDRLRLAYARPLYLLTAIMAVVLCIACANVAGLLLMRTAARQRELAMRLALGAGRARLVRQLLTESSVLAALGTAAGIVLAFVVRGSLLPALNSGEAPIELSLGLSPSLVGFSIVVCLLVGLACGILPALRATPAGAALALGRTVGGSRSGAPRLFAGRTLIALQVALSLVLIVGAALFTHSLVKLRSQALGFRADHLLLFRLDARTAGYDGRRLLDFYEGVLERVSALPGVQAAAFSRWGLLEGSTTRDGIRLAGAAPSQEDVSVHVHYVSPGFFATMGIAMLAGRDVSAQDRETSPRVAVVNQALARQIAGDPGAAVGRSFFFEGPDQPVQVVGLVADARFATLRDAAPATMYLPYRQYRQHRMSFAARVVGEPTALTEAVRQAVAGVGADVPLFGVRTQIDQIDVAVRQERVFAWLASGFGLLALVMACLGIYGTLGYGVARRWPEIGLRIALGATRWDVVSLVLRESLAPVLVGAAMGIGLALATTRFVQSQLFGVAPRDPATLLTATIALVAAALLAAWLPSRRASSVDPVTALRCE